MLSASYTFTFTMCFTPKKSTITTASNLKIRLSLIFYLNFNTYLFWVKAQVFDY